MKYSTIILGLALFIGAGASPVPEIIPSTLRVREADEQAPEAVLNKHDGGRRYEGLEEWPHNKPPSKSTLNGKSEKFYQNMLTAHDQNPDPSKQDAPGVVAAHFHASAPGQPGHIAYSSTMAVAPGHKGFLQPQAYVNTAKAANQKMLDNPNNPPVDGVNSLKGKIAKGQTSIAHQTQPVKTVDGDPHKNFAKCAEAGTCSLIEKQYGGDVNMNGDKVSAYGKHGKPGEQGEQVGHLPACSKGNHKQFNCADVGAHNGHDDVNKPGRPDSPEGSSYQKPPPAPVRVPKRPFNQIESNDKKKPLAPSTPPKHYELPTASSLAKQKPKISKKTRSLRRRALLRRAYLARRFAEVEDSLYSDDVI